MQHQTPFTTGMVYGDLDLLFITIRGVEGEGGAKAPEEAPEEAPKGAEAGHTAAPGATRTRVVIRAPLRKSRRTQWWWTLTVGGALTLGSGVVGVSLGLGLGAALPPLLALAAAAIPGAVAAGGMGAGNLWAFRRIWEWGIGKSREALEEMLGAVDVRIRTGGGFQLPDPGKPGGKASAAFPLFER